MHNQGSWSVSRILSSMGPPGTGHMSVSQSFLLEAHQGTPHTLQGWVCSQVEPWRVTRWLVCSKTGEGIKGQPCLVFWRKETARNVQEIRRNLHKEQHWRLGGEEGLDMGSRPEKPGTWHYLQLVSCPVISHITRKLPEELELHSENARLHTVVIGDPQFSFRTKFGRASRHSPSLGAILPPFLLLTVLWHPGVGCGLRRPFCILFYYSTNAITSLRL